MKRLLAWFFLGMASVAVYTVAALTFNSDTYDFWFIGAPCLVFIALSCYKLLTIK